MSFVVPFVSCGFQPRKTRNTRKRTLGIGMTETCYLLFFVSFVYFVVPFVSCGFQPRKMRITRKNRVNCVRKWCNASELACRTLIATLCDQRVCGIGGPAQCISHCLNLAFRRRFTQLPPGPQSPLPLDWVNHFCSPHRLQKICDEILLLTLIQSVR